MTDLRKAWLKRYFALAGLLIVMDSFLYFLAFHSGIVFFANPENGTNWIPMPDGFSQAILWSVVHLPFVYFFVNVLDFGNENIPFIATILVQNFIVAIPVTGIITLIRNKRRSLK